MSRILQIVIVVIGLFMVLGFIFLLDEITGFIMPYLPIETPRLFHSNLIGWTLSFAMTIGFYFTAYKLNDKYPLIESVSLLLLYISLFVTIGLLIPLYNTW